MTSEIDRINAMSDAERAEWLREYDAQMEYLDDMDRQRAHQQIAAADAATFKALIQSLKKKAAARNARE
jgi:hypothetical protein